MSAPRNDEVYVGHIRDAIARIETYLAGVSQEQFVSTPLIQDGVIHQIQIIGEAAKRLSSEFRARAPGIPWSDITGMRDKIVHDYMGIDLDAVWGTATRDVPMLKVELTKLGRADAGPHGA